MIIMGRLFQKTMLEQVQAELDNPFELIKKPTPKAGWIRIIRQALGMTSYKLAKRVGCAQANIISLEKSEKAGTITMNSLEQTAKAMNCRLVYFLVPEKSLIQIIEDQARIIAKKKLKAVSHSMALEKQALTSKQAKNQEDALVKELLEGPLKYLWDE